MIDEKDLTKAGVFTKTHGIKGELNALLDIGTDYFGCHDCFICIEEGIPTPFYIETCRTKGSQGLLIKPVEIDSEIEAKPFVGKSIYIDKREYRHFAGHGADAGGEYVSDLVGWTVSDAVSRMTVGEITDVNLETANPLLIVTATDGDTVFIPVAEEFIMDIDEKGKAISMRLPEGLLNLNKKLTANVRND